MTTLEIPTTDRIVRRFAATIELEEGAGRTIVGRCAPFDVITDVADGAGVYREVIRHGAFRRSTKAPNRVALTFEHRTDLGNEIGRAVELREEADGLYGVFRAHDSTLGDHGLAIIRSGGTTGLSVCAVVHPAGSKLVDGVVERRLLLLEHVAVTADPAYPGAEITALRSGAVRAPVAVTLAKNRDLRAKFTR